MNIITKIFLSIVLLPIFFLGGNNTLADKKIPQENTQKEISLQIFVRDGCIHCRDFENFLAEKNISYEEYNISEIQNREKFLQITENFEILAGTPLTLAGDTLFSGYSDNKTGEKILETYSNSEAKFSFDDALDNPEKISVYSGISASTCEANSPDGGEESEECRIPEQKHSVKIPFWGKVEISTLSTSSLYGASFIIGFLDGFNPCAMWVLIMFILTLMQIGDRVKMAFVAGTFLIAEAVMYGFILVVWWKFFNVLSAYGFDMYLQIAIGIVAVGAGIFFLYEGIFTDGTCQVTNKEKQKSISKKISDIAHSPLSWAMFAGILALAFSVNVIEFACSAGYPQLFTSQVLGASSATIFDKIGFLLTYLGAYMLDDLIVFAIALFSIEKLGVMQKYGRGFNIFGGVAMLVIGILMLFFPEILKAAF